MSASCRLSMRSFSSSGMMIWTSSGSVKRPPPAVLHDALLSDLQWCVCVLCVLCVCVCTCKASNLRAGQRLQAVLHDALLSDLRYIILTMYVCVVRAEVYSGSWCR